MRIGWLDPFIVLLFRFDDFEAEFLIEVDRALVVHLHMAVKINNFLADDYFSM